jgi:hypothetical protein
MHTTAAQLDEEEDVEPLQPDRLDSEEIDGQQALAVCADELAPGRLPGAYLPRASSNKSRREGESYRRSD